MLLIARFYTALVANPRRVVELVPFWFSAKLVFCDRTLALRGIEAVIEEGLFARDLFADLLVVFMDTTSHYTAGCQNAMQVVCSNA
jgi:hypothetical protein